MRDMWVETAPLNWLQPRIIGLNEERIQMVGKPMSCLPNFKGKSNKCMLVYAIGNSKSTMN